MEMLVFFAWLPPLILAGGLFLRQGWLILGSLFLLGCKAALLFSVPPAGLNMRIFEDHPSKLEGAWEKTWDTFWHPGRSALVRRDLRDAREFPVEWANRFGLLAAPAEVKKNPESFLDHPVDRKKLTDAQIRQILGFSGNERFIGEVLRKTLQPVMAVQAWIFLRKGESVDLFLDKFQDPGSLHLQDAAGNRVAGAWDRDRQGMRFATSPQDSWYYLEGDAVMPPLEECDANLRIRIQDGTGVSRPAYSRQRVWTGVPSWPLLAGPIGMALSRLIDAGFLMLLGGLSLLSVRQIVRAPRGVNLLTLVLAAGLCGWLVRWANLPVFQGSALVCMVGAVGGFWLFRGNEPAGFSPARGLLLIFSLAVVPLFMKQWWGEVPRMGFFSVGDDWMAFQNHARNIFVFGDMLNLRSDPVYANQPGSRYWVGFGHLLFGQSAFSTRMIDLWSILACATLVAAMAVKLDAPGVVAWISGALTGAAFFWPPSGPFIGAGLQEPLAAASLAAVLYRVVTWKNRTGLDWILAFWVCWAFWTRMDHLPALLAGALFFLAPTRGGWRQVMAGWGSRKQEILGKAAWLGFWIAFAVAAVVARNLVAGNGPTLTSGRHMASKLAGNFLQTLEMPALILRADAYGTWGISPMGWFLIVGCGLALLGIFCRRGWVQKLPVEPCLLFWATLSPYFLMREFAYAPRFSFHLVPIAGLLWAGLMTAWLARASWLRSHGSGS